MVRKNKTTALPDKNHKHCDMVGASSSGLK